ncbi:hypothetical protein [Methylobacterium nigriterrae]|uniref:hypothetical protein n=1 Tax=Methylobacterium nigriterrae TaxID=3127512 RepID=UPI0030139294
MQKLSDDAHSVALISLTNMVRLLSAELVAGTHRDDVRRLEQAIRAKVGRIDTTAFTPEAADKGLAEARMLIEQVLTQVRAQAAAARRKVAIRSPERPLATTLH